MPAMNFRSFFLLTLTLPAIATAAGAFSGAWTVDLRTPAEIKRNAECGRATFQLLQEANKITGNHSMSTADCGRVNEGGEGTVQGVVIGATAVLVVTSGRNGEIIIGTATVAGRALRWRVREQIKAGEPEGDSALILSRGVLLKERP